MSSSIAWSIVDTNSTPAAHIAHVLSFSYVTLLPVRHRCRLQWLSTVTPVKFVNLKGVQLTVAQGAMVRTQRGQVQWLMPVRCACS